MGPAAGPGLTVQSELVQKVMVRGTLSWELDWGDEVGAEKVGTAKKEVRKMVIIMIVAALNWSGGMRWY